MAGTICADTLQDGAGNSTAMDNAIYGSAKAWVSVNASGTILASYNVSSVTIITTGIWKVVMTNALVDANYAYIGACNSYASGDRGNVFANANSSDSGSVANPTTTTFFYRIQNTSGSLYNEPHSVAVFR